LVDEERKPVIVSKQCADFLIPPLATAVNLRFLLKILHWG